MKRDLKQAVLRLPLIGPLARDRNMWRMRLRALLGPLGGYSAGTRLDALHSDIAQLLRLVPVFVAADRRSFAEASARADLSRDSDSDPPVPMDSAFHLRRFCLCCNETTPMRVDPRHHRMEGPGSTLNWREALVCGHCGMNNRQRLLAKLVHQAADEHAEICSVYLMEQMTPVFEWMRRLEGADVHGSEYLGYEHKGGDRIRGIRHEDVMNLSYPDGSFDVIASNDVLEHIPDCRKALSECFRVLKPRGAVLATFPFHVGNDTTAVRARLEGEIVEHVLPARYHGNPLSSDGSLVSHDFGWDLFDVAKEVGFASAACELYSSDEFGHLGPGLLVFRLSKSIDV